MASLWGGLGVSFPVEIHPCPTLLTAGALFAFTAQVGAGRNCLKKNFMQDRPVPCPLTAWAWPVWGPALDTGV